MSNKVPDNLQQIIEAAFLKAGAPKPASLILKKNLKGTQLGVNPHLLGEDTHVLRVNPGKQGEQGFFNSEAAFTNLDLPKSLQLMPGKGDQLWVVGPKHALEDVTRRLLMGKSGFTKVTHTALVTTEKMMWAVGKGIKDLIPNGISK